ncbi:MAG TPA: hypothetical protein VGR06_00550 [Actinophytocola sp.]|uniref:hypothetical protein n=1 Tax=Actinophytocola sp. TaxID=1872138 RepID=UPI002DFE874E|nr:hypothetical protein [Actinophytocola sp.]
MEFPRSTGLAPVMGIQITRSQVIERAQSWLRPSVAYSQTDFHTNEYGTYRTDCSGYVSMAWALPGKPQDRHGGLDTIGLAGVSRTIAKHQLRAGDVLLRTEGTGRTRHATVFDRWADAARDAYWGFEQAGGLGTVHRVIAYPYGNTSHGYRAVRFIGLIEKQERDR